jgi:hypothetical protein
MNKLCGHKECPEEYCLIRFYYEEHCKMNDILNLKNSKYQSWKYGCCMPKKTALHFCGVTLTLYPNGTYNLEDSTGG